MPLNIDYINNIPYLQSHELSLVKINDKYIFTDMISGTVFTCLLKNEQYLLHSFDDEPAIIKNNSIKIWYIEDELGRINNNATEICNGKIHKWYNKKGELHNMYGPALIDYAYKKPDIYKEWWIEGIQYSTESDFLKQIYTISAEAYNVILKQKSLDIFT